MTRWRIVGGDKGTRLVRTVSPWSLRLWLVLAAINAIATVADLVRGDWLAAITNSLVALLFVSLVSRTRDINALLGGHR